MAPFILAHAEANPEGVGALLVRLGELAWPYRVSRGWGKPSGLDLSAAVIGPLFGVLGEKQGETRPELREITLRQLRAALAAPTLEQARAAAASFSDELREAAAQHAAAETSLQPHEREQGQPDLDESDGDESLGVPANEQGIMARARRSLSDSLSERREQSGERDSMSRTRAHLHAGTSDEHFARIAPDADHFDRLS